MLKIAYDPLYCLPLPEGHRFPMQKYELLPQQLLQEGTAGAENFFSPEHGEKWVHLVHDRLYVKKLIDLALSDKEIRRVGFPLSHQLIEREFLIASGTVRCAEYALQHGVSFNIAGGTHHAFSDHGEGYCLLNDQAIAARYVIESGLAKKIVIVDLDVHQGNGTAKIFKDDPKVYTFSMHCQSNYPYHKELSDVDIGLADDTDDQVYLNRLEAALDEILKVQKPDFAFFLAGVDVLKTDQLGHLALTLQGCKNRDQLILNKLRLRSVPVVVCMGGGYSKRIYDIVEAHANTFRVARELFN